jgi:TonB family protein
MTEQQQALSLDSKLLAEDAIYSRLLHRKDDRKFFWIALGLAVLSHAFVLVLRFPEIDRTLVPGNKKTIIVKKYTPPPPKVEKRKIIEKKITKKVPLPDPTPDEPEPIREPEPEILPDPIPDDVDVLLGDPELPPPSGPLMPGSGGVTMPVRIEESYVQPEYPELARQARLEGTVILQVVIQKDGSVSEPQILRVDKANLGFETSAVDAVTQWRYTPSLQNGKAVAVYLTVHVQFSLH